MYRSINFDCFDLIEHITKAFTLEPGDIIATGTSSGVGVVLGKYLVPNDVVRIELENVGTLENKVVSNLNLKLYFLRHAKSSWDDLHLDDFKRPLSERGLKNSEMLNAFLKSKKISFDKVYSSSSVRTEITCSVGLEGIYDFEK